MSEGVISIREIIEGWPLLTLETEANGDSESTNKKGFFLRWVPRAGTRDFCPALAALVGPVQNIF
jgi:hypothetical protein